VCVCVCVCVKKCIQACSLVSFEALTPYVMPQFRLCVYVCVCV
jgi:hypothetical protein